MRIQKLDFPFQKDVEFQHTDPCGAGGLTPPVQPGQLHTGSAELQEEDLQTGEEPQKPLSCSLPTPFSLLRSNSKLRGQTTKQESPVTWSWL